MNNVKLWDLKRLLACLAAGFVLALMYGTQEGSQTDFGISFRQAIGIANGGFPVRLVVFLVVGLVIYALVTFSGVVSQYIRRPGVLPLGLGTVVVLASQALMNWYDRGDREVQGHQRRRGGLAPRRSHGFGWLAWALLALAITSPLRHGAGPALLGYGVAVIGLAAAVDGLPGPPMVIDLYGGVDHSLGHYADMVGFLRHRRRRGDHRSVGPRGRRHPRVRRPGHGLAARHAGRRARFDARAARVWVLRPGSRRWRSRRPCRTPAPCSATPGWRRCQGLSGLARLVAVRRDFVVDTGRGVPAQPAAVLVGAVLGVASLVITLLAMKSFTDLGAQVGPQFGRKWQNLGAGGWMACIAFSFAAAAGLYRRDRGPGPAKTRANGLPVSDLSDRFRSSLDDQTVLLVAVAAALFYPQTLPVTWQNVIVDPDRGLHPADDRAERRDRLGRSARPRLHRVLRHRVLHDRVFHGLAADQASVLAAHDAAAGDPVRDRRLRHRRCPARRPGTASSG